MMEALEVIARLGLESQPEGGHFRETWRAMAKPGGAVSPAFALSGFELAPQGFQPNSSAT